MCMFLVRTCVLVIVVNFVVDMSPFRRNQKGNQDKVTLVTIINALSVLAVIM